MRVYVRFTISKRRAVGEGTVHETSRIVEETLQRGRRRMEICQLSGHFNDRGGPSFLGRIGERFCNFPVLLKLITRKKKSAKKTYKNINKIYKNV